MNRTETLNLPLPPFEGIWQSNGGPTRGHPARAFPHSFECPVQANGDLARILLTGVFALYAGAPNENPGTIGASIQCFLDKSLIFGLDLLNGRHYFDASLLNLLDVQPGDGTSLKTVGIANVGDTICRQDRLTIDLPPGIRPTSIVFKDLGSPASFVIQSLAAEVVAEQGCPFREHAGGVPLSELGAVLRLADRPRFDKALKQLEASILSAEDLDEARGEALLFLAVTTAGTIELGGRRSMHRIQLEAARQMECCTSREDVASLSAAIIAEVTQSVFAPATLPAVKLMNRALVLVERNFANPISDATVADQLGLSTSHFRFLFRQSTGQPFHRYLISYRLERARRLLAEEEMTVSAVAQAVGFVGLSHFSRAFSQKFRTSPTSIRRLSA